MKTKLALSILLLTLFFSFEKGMAQAPAWAWAKSAGSNYSDRPFGIATDANGNVLVTGHFQSDSITFGATTLVNADAGHYDIFVVKYDASGNVLWAKSAGGNSGDYGRGICTDISGNVIVTGHFSDTSITFGTTTLTNPGGSNTFIVKYDVSGNVLWAKSVGGISDGQSISTDVNGNILVAGVFQSNALTLGTTTLTNAGGNDIFVVKYDASGNVLWAKSAGGTLADIVHGISTDASGNILVTGSYSSPSLTFGTATLTNSGAPDIFIVKYDASGNVLWAKSAGGTSYDNGTGISTDGSDNVLVTGYFESPSITFATTTLTNAGSRNIFIVKYDASGNVVWAKSAGGTVFDNGQSIIADASGNVLATGSFRSASIAFGTTTLNNSGSTTTYDIFIVKYDASGNVVWAKSAGGTSQDEGNGITSDASGNVLITGDFGTAPITFGTTTLTNSGSDDIFVAKLDNTTGLTEQTPTNSVTLYPNPATDYLTINTNSTKKQVITISDITGKIIYSTTTLSEKTIINTKDFPQGVYAVQVQTGDAVQTRKIVVTR